MAVTLTATELSRLLAVNQALADRLHGTAVALVERYAPEAPEAVQNEATIRCAGWLVDQPAAGIRSMRTGDLATTFDMSRSQAALRNSGAMGILSAWKVRRGGAI